MTNPTPHGQVPDALRLAHIFDNPLPPEWPDMVAAAAELRRQHARIAELEAQIKALSGVQALSAAPAIGDELRDTLVAVSAAIAERDDRSAQKMICEILAASPTPPAEQQAQPGAVYAELPQPDSWFHFTAQFWENKLRDFADRTHALRVASLTAAYRGELDKLSQRNYELRLRQAPAQAVPAEWLEQAYREGWAACRDAETIVEEAEDWAFGNSTANSRMIDAQQAAPQQEAQEVHCRIGSSEKQAGDVVAYLDVGASGYLDLGAALSEDALQQLPKGRHALVIAGTYGIDGYVAAQGGKT